MPTASTPQRPENMWQGPAPPRAARLPTPPGGGAVGEDADREHAPEAGEHVAGHRPHRVVQLHDALEETGAVDDDGAGDAADDHRRPGLDEGAGGRGRPPAAADAGAPRRGG